MVKKHQNKLWTIFCNYFDDQGWLVRGPYSGLTFPRPLRGRGGPHKKKIKDDFHKQIIDNLVVINFD
jgi:hypothetical protein